MFSITFFGYKGFPTRKCILSKNIKGCHKRSLTIVKNEKRKKFKSLTKPHTKTKKTTSSFFDCKKRSFKKKISFLKTTISLFVFYSSSTKRNDRISQK